MRRARRSARRARRAGAAAPARARASAAVRARDRGRDRAPRCVQPEAASPAAAPWHPEGARRRTAGGAPRRSRDARLAQSRRERARGPPAVRDRVLLLGSELRHRAQLARRHEQRVVAEAGAAAWRTRQLSLDPFRRRRSAPSGNAAARRTRTPQSDRTRRSGARAGPSCDRRPSAPPSAPNGDRARRSAPRPRGPSRRRARCGRPPRPPPRAPCAARCRRRSRHPPRRRSHAPRRRRRADGTARRPCRRSPWRAPRATGSSLDRHSLQLLGLDALHPAAPSSSRRSSCARSNGLPSAVPCSSTRRRRPSSRR